MEKYINNVVQGDCLEILKEFNDKSIDLILCDLPYQITDCKWDSLIPLDDLWKQYNRIIKDNGAIVLTASGLFTGVLMTSNTKMFKYKYVWEKSKSTNFMNAKKQPLRKHEDILVFYKKQPTYNPQMVKGKPYTRKESSKFSEGYSKVIKRSKVSDGLRYPTDILKFNTAEVGGNKIYHPSQKPIDLAQFLIKTYTNENDIVLDNACGSGSFLVAAKMEGRRYIGIDKNQDVSLHGEKIDCIQVCNERLASIK